MVEVEFCLREAYLRVQIDATQGSQVDTIVRPVSLKRPRMFCRHCTFVAVYHDRCSGSPHRRLLLVGKPREAGQRLSITLEDVPKCDVVVGDDVTYAMIGPESPGMWFCHIAGVIAIG